ncbi:MAG TPA: hypothetical protein HA230_04975 [Candidatus Aenigmarchaeota archaeon]|nr:hypothetical protein [Candidatus Aenigmarchaeota archaeon]
MPDEQPLRIEFELFPDDNSAYLVWNVAGCVRRLRDAPHEYDITLMVYEIHKDILRKRGISDDDLNVGDRYVEEAKAQCLRGVN